MTNYNKLLSYNDLLFIGIGNIIGAGIFFLIKYINDIAKEKTWLSILIGGLFMFILSYKYSKLPTEYSNYKNIEQEIINKKYGNTVSNIVLLCVIIGLIFGGYIVADAFSKYFNHLTDISHEISVLLLIGICYLMNIYKIDVLANFNTIITIIGIGIISLIIIIGFYKIIIDKNTDFTKYYKFNNFNKEIWNILKGAYLIIFSYFGFEILIKLNKESKNPLRDIPSSMNHSMILVIIIYTLMGIIYSYAINLKKNKYDNFTPITDTMEILTNTNKYNNFIDITACIFTANTLLIMILGASRLLDDIINIDKNINVPRKSILIVTLSIIILFCMKYNIEKSTALSNLLRLTIFGAIIL